VAKRGHHGIRVLGLAVLATGVVAALFSPDCSASSCPDYALNNPWILRGERGGLTIIVLLAVLAAFWRVVVEGQFPNKIGREGLEWPDAAAGAKESISALEAAVRTLTEDSERDEKNLADLARAASTAINDLAVKVGELENRRWRRRRRKRSSF
jgi:hypothetical protein